MSSIAQKVGPPTIVSTGWAWNVNSVTTPKLPPPPRIAQKSPVLVGAGRDPAAVGEHQLGGSGCRSSGP